MSMSYEDMLATFDPEDQARIKAETERLHAEYLTLQELRKAKALTQTQLAEALDKKQATIAQMERRADLMLSTLRSYVEAMGGHLNLVVEFPDRPPVILRGLGEIDADAQ